MATKNKKTMSVYLKIFASGVIIFFTPIWTTLLFIGFVVFLDTVFGIIRSIKLRQPVVSRKLFRFAKKSATYLTVIAVMFAFDKLMLNDVIRVAFGDGRDFFVSKLIGVFFVGIELYSIDESIRIMNQDRGFKYYFKKLISTAKTVKDDVNELKS